MNNAKKAKEAYFEAYKGINVKENEQIVLECKTLWSYDFALKIPGADIKAHEQVILGLKNPCFSFYFARDVIGANIEEHFKLIYNFGNQSWIDCFIQFVNYKNTKVEEWLLYI